MGARNLESTNLGSGLRQPLLKEVKMPLFAPGRAVSVVSKEHAHSEAHVNGEHN